MSIYNSSLSVSFSVTVAGSESTFVQTEVVYYAYTAIAYSIYISYYISTFTVYYPSEAAINGNNTTIIATCAPAAAVVVVILFVVVLIKILRRNQGSSKDESDNLEQYDMEGTNIFSGVLSASNIKEDPFAEDFKEDKFVYET